MTSRRGRVDDEIARTRPCILKPFKFFISWQGVLTVAYSGWPPALTDLKRRLSSACGNALPEEHPGSKWPKTTLAALKKNRRLVPSELALILRICNECSAALQHDRCEVVVDTLSVVLYKCRCLSEVLSLRTMTLSAPRSQSRSEESNILLSKGSRELQGSGHLGQGLAVDTEGGDLPIARCVARFMALTASSNSGIDESEPSEAEHAYVCNVLAEAHKPDYWLQVSRDGRRIDHYTEDAPGATICHFLISEESRCVAAFIDIISEFQARIHKELPDMYTFFPPDSLHVTLRALS